MVVMHVHEDRKLIYFRTMKTASTTTYRMLEKIGFKYLSPFDAEDRGWWPTTVSKELASRSPILQEKLERYYPHAGLREIPEGWRAFTNIRNPFDCFISWHQFRAPYPENGRVRPTTEFLRLLLWHERAFIPISHRLCGMHYTDTHKIRFESLREDLQEFLGQEIPELEHATVGKKRRGAPYHGFYTTRVRAQVQHQFAPEFEEYGYSWEHKPFQIQK